MWHHSQAKHQGIIGADQGLLDYKFEILYTFRKNMSRQAEEGIRQTDLEGPEQLGVLTCMNSKIDFVKPLKTSMRTYCGNQKANPNEQISLG